MIFLARYIHRPVDCKELGDVVKHLCSGASKQQRTPSEHIQSNRKKDSVVRNKPGDTPLRGSRHKENSDNVRRDAKSANSSSKGCHSIVLCLMHTTFVSYKYSLLQRSRYPPFLLRSKLFALFILLISSHTAQRWTIVQ